MRYAEPSHDMMANEWNSEAIVEDNVEVIVLSTAIRTRRVDRRRKQPTCGRQESCDPRGANPYDERPRNRTRPVIFIYLRWGSTPTIFR